MKITSPRHQKIIRLLSRVGNRNTHQIAKTLGIPKSVSATCLHYMEERGFVCRAVVGKSGKLGLPAVWEVNGQHQSP